MYYDHNEGLYIWDNIPSGYDRLVVILYILHTNKAVVIIGGYICRNLIITTIGYGTYKVTALLDASYYKDGHG